MPKNTKTNNSESLTSGLNLDQPVNSSPIRKYFPWLILALVVVIGGLLFFNQRHNSAKLEQQLEELKQNPQKITQEETKSLLEKIGSLIELPDEQPTIATVSDLAPLKDQPFFARAQIGDKVLIYTEAKKAVLYRLSTNKVIEVAPVNLDAPAQNINTENTVGSSSNANSSRSSSSNSNSSTSRSNSNSAVNANTNANSPIDQ